MSFRHQPFAAAALASAMQFDRLAHAYAFVGPRGIGKRAAAYEFAASLMLGEPRFGPDAVAPADLPSQRILAGIHPDVRVYEPPEGKKFFVVETIEQMLDDLSLTPLEAPLRVAIVDRAEMMNDAAANRLLKTLEEPPRHARLILLVSEWFRLLETVRSRVQAVRFRPLPPGPLAEAVGADPDDPAHAALVPLANGSPGEFARLVDEGFPEVRAHLAANVIDRPAPDPVDAAQALGELTRRKSDPTQEAQRDRLRSAIGQLAIWWRDALAAGRLGAAEPIDADPSRVRALAGKLRDVAPARAAGHIDAILDLLDDLAMNMNMQLFMLKTVDLAMGLRR
jgi:DNA polymerase-3 subunit delta'